MQDPFTPLAVLYLRACVQHARDSPLVRGISILRCDYLYLLAAMWPAHVQTTYELEH